MKYLKAFGLVGLGFVIGSVLTFRQMLKAESDEPVTSEDEEDSFDGDDFFEEEGEETGDDC